MTNELTECNNANTWITIGVLTGISVLIYTLFKGENQIPSEIKIYSPILILILIGIGYIKFMSIKY